MLVWWPVRKDGKYLVSIPNTPLFFSLHKNSWRFSSSGGATSAGILQYIIMDSLVIHEIFTDSGINLLCLQYFLYNFGGYAEFELVDIFGENLCSIFPHNCNYWSFNLCFIWLLRMSAALAPSQEVAVWLQGLRSTC